jgi:hypothetical protein
MLARRPGSRLNPFGEEIYFLLGFMWLIKANHFNIPFATSPRLPQNEFLFGDIEGHTLLLALKPTPGDLASSEAAAMFA